MAKDLSLLISADASKAVSGMNGFTESINKMAKSVAIASNTLDQTAPTDVKYIDNAKALGAAENNLLEALQKKARLQNQEAQNVKSLQKSYNDLTKVMQNLQMMQGNQDTGALKQIATWRTELNNQISELTPKTFGSADSNELAFYSLIGDEIGRATAKLSQYEKALKNSIKYQGENSEAAKKAADAYKKQKEEVDKLSSSTEKSNSRVKNLIKSFVSAQAIVYLVQKGFYLLTSALTEWSATAAKAEETANLFNTTFSQIESSANNIASTMASSMGMATSTMQEALGMFGDLAMGYGQSQAAALSFAETAVQTSLDIISFKNIVGDTTEIMSAFASGLAGNFENFRKYGYIITQAEIKTRLQEKGLDKLSGSALQFAKVQETLNIIIEKSANAQGDLVKTLDSTENINRRLAEANKALIETLGKGINTVLNPLKLVWIDIADSINKAVQAQKQFSDGQKNISVYDIHNNENDALSFSESVKSAFRVPVWTENRDIRILEDLAVTMRLFGATADDVISIMDRYGLKYSSQMEEVLRLQDKTIAQEKQQETLREKQRTEFTNTTSNYVSVLDSVNSITGVSPTIDYGASIARIEIDTDATRALMGRYFRAGLEDAFNALSSASFGDFASQLDLVFGSIHDFELDGLTAQAESLKSFYETIYNAIESGQVNLENSAELLSSIVSRWQDVQKEIEEVSAYNEALSFVSSSMSNVNTQIRQAGMSDEEKAIDDIISEWSKALENIGDRDVSELNTQFSALIESTKKLYKVQDDLTKQEEYRAALEEAQNSLNEAISKNTTYSLNERQSSNYEINQQRAAALASATNEDQIAELTAVFDAWIKENEKYYDKLAETAIGDFNSNLAPVTATYSYAGFGTNVIAQNAYNEAMQKGMDMWYELETLLKDYGYSTEELTAVQAQAMKDIQDNAIKAGKSASSKAQGDMFDDIFGNAMSAMGEIGDVITSIMDAASIAGGVWGVVINLIIKLIAQTEVFVELANTITDSILPAINAFLKPMLPVLEATKEVIGQLFYDILNPLYELMIQINEITLVLFESLQPLFDIFNDVSDVIGDTLYPIFAALGNLFSILIQPLNIVMVLLRDFLIPVFNIFTPLLELLSKAFIVLYAAVNVSLNFVVDIVKWMVGNVVSFFTSMINGVIKVLRSINIFGWRPFGGLKTIDDSMWREWANINPFENAQKNWDDTLSLLDSINKSNMEISDNTSKADISDLEKVYEKGLISGSEFEALVADKLGLDYKYKDDYSAYFDQYAQNQGTRISYGTVNIEINGYSGNAKELAREIKKILQEDNVNPKFNMVV